MVAEICELCWSTHGPLIGTHYSIHRTYGMQHIITAASHFSVYMIETHLSTFYVTRSVYISQSIVFVKDLTNCCSALHCILFNLVHLLYRHNWGESK